MTMSQPGSLTWFANNLETTVMTAINVPYHRVGHPPILVVGRDCCPLGCHPSLRWRRQFHPFCWEAHHAWEIGRHQTLAFIRGYEGWLGVNEPEPYMMGTLSTIIDVKSEPEIQGFFDLGRRYRLKFRKND